MLSAQWEQWGAVPPWSTGAAPTQRPVKDKEGKPITGEEGQKKRWMEHFLILNTPAPQDPPHIQQADRDLPIDLSAPRREKIREAIKKLRNGKAVGSDSIPAKTLKTDAEIIREMFHPLFKKMWEEENILCELRVIL